MSTVFLHVGQAGCQIGEALWPALAQERPGSPEFFRTRSEVCPRAILVDAEPKVVESVLSQVNGTYSFDPASAVMTQSGRGGNFALGYSGDSLGHASSLDGDVEPLWAKAVDRFRQQVEACHGRHMGTYLAHSLGGGTGSGLGARLAEELRDAYPKASLLATSILPISSGENPMQSYNAILSLSCMQEVADGVVLYENDVLLASASSTDDSKAADHTSGASLASMNSILVRDIVPHLCPFSQVADLSEVLSAIVPLPSHKIVQAFSGEVLPSLGPPTSPKPTIDALRLPRSARNSGNVIAARAVVRGAPKQLLGASSVLKDELLDRLGGAAPWQPFALDVLCGTQSLRSAPAARASMLTNWRRVTQVLRGLHARACKKYASRMFLHWYETYGFGPDAFAQAFEQVERTIWNYEGSQ
ncbi:tubd1 [Symbiodinium natans]|uniref:Tubulin delta chain n=1 Tax=Symbiodinium natans TaxID=878477 RepID=A0A812PP14_9DINO|nr:tubd1 [Symbiodinium natans]